VGLAVAGVFAGAELRSGRTAKADGVIVKDGYNALIEFTTAGGQPVQFYNWVNYTSNVVGDHVPVAYDPANPQGAEADSFVGRWFPSGLAALIATPLFMVGFGFAIAAWAIRPARRRDLAA
jgi:hypothetical protein